MATPFLGEIKLVSFNFPPTGWAFCNGQFLPINQNQALFALLGTTYGGNGQTTFALPDLRGRMPLHHGNGFTQGQAGGEEAHTVTLQELPQHIHAANFSATAASSDNPAGNLPGRTVTPTLGPPQSFVAMAPAAVGNIGGSQAHQNMAPFLALNFCIALQGIFPSQN